MAIPGNRLSATTESIDPNGSGWRARMNCSTALGTGGRNGPNVLSVKSAAAGEMQAETVSAYSVVAGETYYTFADAACGSQPERIGIEWLDNSYSPVGSITWSLTTTAASSSLHRVSVAGVAPVGATRVRIVLSSTPAAGNISHFWENVYFGLPIRSQGNLFSFNTESGGELDSSSWTAETNCTISRQAPAVQWDVDWYYSGGHTIAMTASAGGNAAMRTTDRPAATAGVEYLAHTYINPPTAASTTWIELRFHDSGGAQLSATRAQLAAPGTGYYRQRVSAVAPAGTASCSVAVGIDSATAAQVLRVDGTVVQVAPQFRAGSVIPYADASIEQGVAGWSVVSGAATVARSTPWGNAAFDGAYALKISSATTTTSVIRSAKFPLAAGSAGLTFRSEVIGQVTAGGWTWSHGVRWYDASNNDLGLTGSSTATFPTPGWWAITGDRTAPAGATQAAVEWTVTATSTNSTLVMDQVSLWQALPLTEVAANPETASVTLTLRELPVGQLLTVYRYGEDGIRTPVRGSSGLIQEQEITSDLMVIEDYEVPLGVSLWYRVEYHTVGATLVSTRGIGALTIDPGDPQYAWLKDPGRPFRNIRVMVQRAPDWQRPVEQAEYRVRGRRNSVVLSDVRGGLEGDLTIWTESDDQRAALHWLLDSGNTLLWQAAPGMGVSDMYVAVGEITEARTSPEAGEQWRSWTLPLKQVDMPVTTGVDGTAGRTWQDVLSEHATWQDVLDNYATWEDVFLDNKIGG